MKTITEDFNIISDIIKSKGNCNNPVMLACSRCPIYKECRHEVNKEGMTSIYNIAIKYLLDNGYTKEDIVEILI